MSQATDSATLRLEELKEELEAVQRQERELARRIRSFDPVACLRDGDLDAFRTTEFFNEKDIEHHDTLFMMAIRLRRWEAVEWLLERAEAGSVYLNVNHRNKHGETALHLLATTNRGATVARAVALGADVHAALPNGWTALHLVFVNGTASNLGPLLDAGANPHARGEHGHSPLDLAGNRMLLAYRKWMAGRLVHRDYYKWFAARDKADQVAILTELIRIAK